MSDVTTSGGHTPERIMMLPNGHTVSPEFHGGVRSRIEEIIPAMQFGVPYTVEQMCGAEFWAPLSNADCQNAGRCVAQMVSVGMLPLRFVGCRHARPKRYEHI